VIEFPDLVAEPAATPPETGGSLEASERRLIFATLERYGGDKKKAAEILGISLKTLYNRLHLYAGD
jgi:DNA-binding NtrC family response regulator